ncbi:hypothetical protein K431DRAFT_281361 [Polychaeton citri CBS 116435]|uniref:Sialidase n=1 Tax=Polychaeton citri CBS 116435 TaxID=1314669 RepID=A0A9P4QFI0_9PEZI|nr:hypothetical protein K431DRAFT_281361 [Polychaeton citri CBS 116435]
MDHHHYHNYDNVDYSNNNNNNSMYGHVTPPQGLDVEAFEDLQCPGGSASTNTTARTSGWSPQSHLTATTTPPRSPLNLRETGPVLLPRVRTQDQYLEPGVFLSQASVGRGSAHSRTTSLPANGFAVQFGGFLPPNSSVRQRSISPGGRAHQISPVSMSSVLETALVDPSLSQRPSLANARSVSASNIRSHSRNTSSSSSIDASILSRFGFPTYRHSPGPQSAPTTVPMSRTPSAMSHLTPIGGPSTSMQTYPSHKRTASPPARPSARASEEPDLDPALDIETSTMLDYLTKPNPTPSLTQRVVEGLRAQNAHFWFDIRNTREWSDFSVETIAAQPGLMDLLKFPVSARRFPQPGRLNLNPENSPQLAELCANHYGVKVNAALKICQGESKAMAVRALTSAPGARQQPEFVSSYQSDTEKTIYGDGRGRVVGIVKCFDQWNSGMRNDSIPQKVKHLLSLAHLHRYMREHECRYGFIITEIEMVCVRAGGPPSEGSNVPLFGYLELSNPIQLSTHGFTEDGMPKMTASLALWWLHMLAKEQPIPGQYGWRMDVGYPAAMTRRNHLPRDSWIPNPISIDKRDAKKVRGWVWPDEPLSKREYGRGRRRV